MLVCELQALALLCVHAPSPRDPYRPATTTDQGDPVAEARRRFDDGLCRLVRRLRRAGKQVVVLGRVGLLPPADRWLAAEAAGGMAVVVVQKGGHKEVKEKEKEKKEGVVGELAPEEQRFEQRLLGASALVDAYRACNPREAGWTMRM